MRKIANKYLRNPRLVLYRVILAFPKLIKSDKYFLKIKYYVNFERWPDLDNPQTFSEKIQWLKLYNRRPEYVQMVDKVEAKKYVAKVIGDEYIIPTLGIYDNVEDIDFESLPNQFVLKCTHDSGGIVICKEKSSLDISRTKKKLEKGLKRNFYWQTREWPYKNVKPRIIAEQYMNDSCDKAKDVEAFNSKNEQLKDYKFFCFNGNPQYCQVISDRGICMSIDFFDKEWIHQPFHEPKEFPFSKKEVKKPFNYKLMIDLAQKLSDGHPFIRVDFYEIHGKVYFGELTFYPTSGVGGFSPEEWDVYFGELIELKSRKHDEK